MFCPLLLQPGVFEALLVTHEASYITRAGTHLRVSEGRPYWLQASGASMGALMDANLILTMRLIL